MHGGLRETLGARPACGRGGRLVNDAVPSLEELRAIAGLHGVDPDDADLAAVREFLSVFLPAAGALSQGLPPDAALPAPFTPGSP